MRLRLILHSLLCFGIVLTVSSVILGAAWVAHLVRDIGDHLSTIEAADLHDLALSTEVYDRRGEKIGELGQERRYFVALKDLPPHVQQAFISAEDKDFRSHAGVDPVAILRATIANIRGKGLRQGASTITQQLARTMFLGREKTWERKIKEAILALAIEIRLDKDRILELYLNQIYLGNRSYGIEAAARNYFRKHAVDLTIGEAALLAGLPKSPSRYAPHRHPKRASQRQAFVLRRMEEDGYLAAGDATLWMRKAIKVAPRAEDHWAKAPYFVAAVQQELERMFENRASSRLGLKIYTTLDAQLQGAAARTLKQGLKQARDQAGKKTVEGAVYTVDPHTGAVLAMQGGARFRASQFDRARFAKRRIAGLMMPLYVSLALERGYTLASRVHDEPMGRRPQGKKVMTPTLYEAVVHGLDYEAAPLYPQLGHGSVLAHARRLGLSFEDADLSLAFGYGEASPEDMAMAYAPFVNGGAVIQPYMIDRIIDAQGQVIYSRNASRTRRRALSPQGAYMTYHLLQDAAREGHAASLGKATPLAAGMATATEDLHDAWTIGILPKAVTALWIGAEKGRVRLAADRNAAMAIPTTICADYMTAMPATYRAPEAALVPPEGLSFTRFEGAQRALPFIAGTEPRSNAARF